MHLLRSPQEAYRQVDFDARVAGANSRQLVSLCYEQLHCALGSALWGDEHGDPALKSRALTRALTALTALQMGIDPAATLAPALTQFYRAAHAALLDCVPHFDVDAVIRIRHDFAEVGQTLAAD
ncbi:MAG: flagellar protein FliS [Proteobacteria bacterium]|nr:flagellar protein FliS [Pseudomonadota bacterium]